MSAAAPAATAAGAVAAAPAKKGKKKLILIAVALLLVLGIGGGAAVFVLKKKPVDADGDEPVAQAADKHGEKPDLKHPPTFLPLDPFVVNLSDKEADRYAQVGITLQVEDAKFAEQMKSFMPAIRNGILMILAHKSSAELLDRAGKQRLAEEILRESARTMGIEVADLEESPAAAGEEATPKKAKKKRVVEPNPIKQVHFSNFIVQ